MLPKNAPPRSANKAVQPSEERAMLLATQCLALGGLRDDDDTAKGRRPEGVEDGWAWRWAGVKGVGRCTHR